MEGEGRYGRGEDEELVGLRWEAICIAAAFSHILHSDCDLFPFTKCNCEPLLYGHVVLCQQPLLAHGIVNARIRRFGY